MKVLSGISAFSFVFFCVAVCCFCFMRLIFGWTVSMAVVYLSTACLTSSCFAVICSEIVSTFFFSGEDLVQCGPVKEDQGL